MAGRVRGEKSDCGHLFDTLEAEQMLRLLFYKKIKNSPFGLTRMTADGKINLLSLAA